MEKPRPSQEEPIAKKPTASVDDLPRRTISIVVSGPFNVGFQGYENSRIIRKAAEEQAQG